MRKLALFCVAVVGLICIELIYIYKVIILFCSTRWHELNAVIYIIGTKNKIRTYQQYFNL